MKLLMNQQLTADIGMVWNRKYWGPQLGTEILGSGNTVDYMASQIATPVQELQVLVVQYNKEYDTYVMAAKSMKLEFQNATHLNVGGVILDRLGGVASKAGLIGAAMHKNSKAAEGSFAMYEIIIEGQTFKYGIADAGRLRKGGQFAGLPERLAQQLGKIAKYATDLAVTH